MSRHSSFPPGEDPGQLPGTAGPGAEILGVAPDADDPRGEAESAAADPLAGLDAWAERQVSPRPNLTVHAPEELFRPVADAVGAEMARRWFGAPCAQLNGRTPASLMRSEPGRVADAARALAAAAGRP